MLLSSINDSCSKQLSCYVLSPIIATGHIYGQRVVRNNHIMFRLLLNVFIATVSNCVVMFKLLFIVLINTAISMSNCMLIMKYNHLHSF